LTDAGWGGNNAASRGRRTLNAIVKKRLGVALAVLAALYAVSMVLVAAYRAHDPYLKDGGNSDYAKFHVTARALVETGRISPDAGVRNYLPAFVVLSAPIAWIRPCWLGAGLFAVLNICAVALTWHLAMSRLVPGAEEWPLRRKLLPLLLVLPFAHDCILMGQMPLLVGLLAVASWRFDRDGRERLAGLMLALAIIIKPFLATVGVFYALKGRWRTVWSCALWGALLGVGLTMLALGRDEWGRAHYDYYKRVLVRETPMTVLKTNNPRYKRFNNQSVAMSLCRLLSETEAGTARRRFTVNVASLPPGAVQAVYSVFMACIAALTLWTGRKPAGRLPPERLNLEFCAFLLWGIFGSPIVWTFYFGLLLYPVTLLTGIRYANRGGAGPRFPVFAWWFWIAAAASLATEAFMPAYLRAAGIHMWAAALVWLSMVVCAGRVGLKNSRKCVRALGCSHA